MRKRNTANEQLVKQKTIELLVTDGFEGFSLNKLAKACGISIATLYIYYKDRDDLIIQIAREEIAQMRDAVIKDFDPEMSFETGLQIQWKNRYHYLMAYPVKSIFIEQLRTSTYHDKVYTGFADNYRDKVDKFMHNIVNRGEIAAMQPEVYWAIAFSPLLTLLRAHYESNKPGGKHFIMTEEVLWQAFELVIKALKI